jgi:glycosyltransferase involved in cell wall biosynthesis
MTQGVSRVSVALCTYNGERFIGEQVASILAQSVLPTEIVLSDDASSDETVAVAETVVAAWLAENPDRAVDFVVLRNTAALGVTGNFEQAIAATTGDFVALSDQDDVWHSNRIERALAAFGISPQTLLLHSDARLVDAGGEALDDTLFSAYDVNSAGIATIRAGAAFDILARRTIVTGATTMIRRPLFELAKPFPAGWVHDEWLAIVASALGALDVIDEQLIDYRQHGANEIGAATLSFFGKFRRMLEPRSDRNRRLLERSESLAERFAAMPQIPAEFADIVRAKLQHERVRSALPARRLLRLPAVVRELRTGRYARFGRGVADAVRDLLQPA